jgi:hypothetical protein
MCFIVGFCLMAGDAPGKTYYRWTDDGGVVQLSDEPPKNRSYQRIVIPDGTPEQQTTGPAPEKKETAGPGKALTEEQQKIKNRQDEVVKLLEEMVVHYSEVGGITAGKLAALKEAVEVVRKAKMDGSEADEQFYDKIAELVRSIRNRTHIIGRVNRLLNEAKAMKGLGPPVPAEGMEPAPPAEGEPGY